jgi:hypothetical protein
MAYIILSKPGTKYGPCKGECEHTDCALTRAQAAAECPHCGKQCGYDKPLTSSPLRNGLLSHHVCVCEHADNFKDEQAA